MQIRLNEVYHEVDHIVLVESAVTHQNSPKPLHYRDNAARFRRFADKIIPIAQDTLYENSSYYRCALIACASPAYAEADRPCHASENFAGGPLQ